MGNLRRGVIKNRDFKNRVADMSGLRFGNITPTDIDAFLDFGDGVFVFIEGKYAGAGVQFGQGLAIQRLCDATHCPPHRYSFLIIADHDTPPPADIDFAEMTVRTYRLNRRWVYPLAPTTVRAAVDKLLAFAKNNSKRH